MPTLKELKALVKGHSTDKPKMSAGKEALLMYAHAMGLLKPKEAPAAVPAPVVEKPAKKLVKMVTAKDDLPAQLKAPVKATKAVAPVKESAKAVAPVKESKKNLIIEDYSGNKVTASALPAKGGFAGFMSANKGKGHNMKTLAEMYRNQNTE